MWGWMDVAAACMPGPTSHSALPPHQQCGPPHRCCLAITRLPPRLPQAVVCRIPTHLCFNRVCQQLQRLQQALVHQV